MPVPCPICDEPNAKRNTWCGGCGSRMRSIPDGFKQDVHNIVDERDQQKRSNRIRNVGLALAILGIFGYNWIHSTATNAVTAQVEALRPAMETQAANGVASQVEALKPVIEKQAATEVAHLMNQQLPTAIDGVITAVANKAHRVGQEKMRELESDWL